MSEQLVVELDERLRLAALRAGALRALPRPRALPALLELERRQQRARRRVLELEAGLCRLLGRKRLPDTWPAELDLDDLDDLAAGQDDDRPAADPAARPEGGSPVTEWDQARDAVRTHHQLGQLKAEQLGEDYSETELLLRLQGELGGWALARESLLVARQRVELGQVDPQDVLEAEELLAMQRRDVRRLLEELAELREQVPA